MTPNSESEWDRLEKLARASLDLYAEEVKESPQWEWHDADSFKSFDYEDAKFIEACKPATILALLSERKALLTAVQLFAASPAERLKYCEENGLIDRSDPEWMTDYGWRRFIARAALAAASSPEPEATGGRGL